MAVQYMRRVIQKKAKFDIMDLNAVQGDKNIIKFEGDHNSPRPQFYYDSVSIFFYNVLHPPQNSSSYSSRVEKYYDLGDLKVGAGMDESLLYEIITGLRAVSTDSASSSSAPSVPKGPSTKSVAELLSENGALTQTKLDATLPDQDALITEIGGNDDEDFHLVIGHQEQKENGQNDECCSYTSSNRESWGRCSSLGGVSEEESSSAECTRTNSRHQTTLKVLATPLRRIQRKSSDVSKEDKKDKKAKTSRKAKGEKLEKLEALSQRLRHCFLGRANHNRQRSS